MKPFWDQQNITPTEQQDITSIEQKIYNCLKHLKSPKAIDPIRTSLGDDAVDNLEAILNEMVDKGNLVLIEPFSLGRPMYWIVK